MTTQRLDNNGKMEPSGQWLDADVVFQDTLEDIDTVDDMFLRVYDTLRFFRGRKTNKKMSIAEDNR